MAYKAVADFFAYQDKSFYTNDIQALQNSCKKCLDRE